MFVGCDPKHCGLIDLIMSDELENLQRFSLMARIVSWPYVNTKCAASSGYLVKYVSVKCGFSTSYLPTGIKLGLFVGTRNCHVTILIQKPLTQQHKLLCFWKVCVRFSKFITCSEQKDDQLSKKMLKLIKMILKNDTS